MSHLASLTHCAPRLESESQRLALLHSMELLDTPADTSFDAITRLAALVTGRPIALIGLVDAERTWFKSRVGLEEPQSPREISFCNAAIDGNDLFEVTDAQADPRFSSNPLVIGAPHVRYYAGMPLRVAGLAMGTVCVVDHVPHQLDEAQRDGLRQLAVLTTELLERRLASRAKSEFIGHMNHELRTPMNAILGFGHILQRGLEPGSRQARQMQHIVDAGQHLLELIDESLDLMRLEAGAERLDTGPVDLVPVLLEVSELVKPLADQRAITLQVSTPPRLFVDGNARRARQVLLNLTSNAIKYSREGGWIALSAGHDGESRPWTAVRDNGTGLTSEQLGRLFKPFERLNQDLGTVQGTGLGLALSARLAEAMGGRIDVTSEVGRGTEFTVRWQGCDAALGDPEHHAETAS